MTSFLTIYFLEQKAPHEMMSQLFSRGFSVFCIDPQRQNRDIGQNFQYMKQGMKRDRDSRYSDIKLLLSLSPSDRTPLVSGETTALPVPAPFLEYHVNSYRPLVRR